MESKLEYLCDFAENSPDLWATLIKQSYGDGAALFLLGLLFLALAASPFQGISGQMRFFLSSALLIAGVIAAAYGAQHLVNPEFYAMRFLLTR